MNCAVFKTECTFTYVAKVRLFVYIHTYASHTLQKRRTQQASVLLHCTPHHTPYSCGSHSFIDSLQTRLAKLERLLLIVWPPPSLAPTTSLTSPTTQVAPDIDISKELDETTATLLARPRPSSPLRAVPRPPPAQGVGPTDVVATFTNWRDTQNTNNSFDDDESEDDERSIFIAQACQDVESGQTPHRFHGNSSGISLLQSVIGMKRQSVNDKKVEYGEELVVHPEPVRIASLMPSSFSHSPGFGSGKPAPPMTPLLHSCSHPPHSCPTSSPSSSVASTPSTHSCTNLPSNPRYKITGTKRFLGLGP